MANDDVSETITNFCTVVVNTLTNQFVPPESLEEQWDVTGVAGEQSLCTLEKHILLRVLNDKWKEHLSTTGHLRQGIHLRGYAARNTSGKREMFSQMF